MFGEIEHNVMEQEGHIPATSAGLPGKTELRVKASDLPLTVVLELPSGEKKKFVLDYAKRTKGLYLNRIED